MLSSLAIGIGFLFLLQSSVGLSMSDKVCLHIVIIS
jgi:PIN domain nuclease of toxin-antitoxin system